MVHNKFSIIVAVHQHLLDSREPLIFLPWNILAKSSARIRGRAAAQEEGARTLTGKNMKARWHSRQRAFINE